MLSKNSPLPLLSAISLAATSISTSTLPDFAWLEDLGLEGCRRSQLGLDLE